jgi:hypothetical protein
MGCEWVKTRHTQNNYWLWNLLCKLTSVTPSENTTQILVVCNTRNSNICLFLLLNSYPRVRAVETVVKNTLWRHPPRVTGPKQQSITLSFVQYKVFRIPMSKCNHYSQNRHDTPKEKTCCSVVSFCIKLMQHNSQHGLNLDIVDV